MVASVVKTFAFGLLGLLFIAFGFLYDQDHHPDQKWYQVLKSDLGVRGIFWVVGLALLSYAGYFQYSHFHM